jgi:hypothetical protein
VEREEHEFNSGQKDGKQDCDVAKATQAAKRKAKVIGDFWL